MPSRKKAKTTRSSTKAAKQKNNAQASSAIVAAPTRRAVRGRRGSLQDMPNMPMDILLEVFAYLHPRDLVNLARTNKDFRAFLMSRHSEPVWRAARLQQKGIPPLPPLLSEPAYANLLFFSHCHNCLKPNIQIVLWRFSARYCPACKGKKFFREWDAEQVLWRASGPSRSLLPLLHVEYTPWGRMYHKPEVTGLMKQWKKLKTEAEREAFEAERKAFMAQMEKHARDCDDYKVECDSERLVTLCAARQVRFRAILDRLIQEGWEADISQMSQSERHDLAQLDGAKKTGKLTDRGWASMRDDFVAEMAKVRARRLEQEREDVLFLRFVCLWRVMHDMIEYDYDEIWADAKPELLDVAFMPKFRSLLELPSHEKIRVHDILALAARIPGGVTDCWQADCMAQCVAILERTMVFPPDIAPLDLAIAIFDCTRCGKIGMRTSDSLFHRCGALCTSGDDLDTYTKAAHQLVHAARQSVGYDDAADMPPKPPLKANVDISLLKASTAIPMLREMLRLCGMDPDVARYADTLECHTRLRCKVCFERRMGATAIEEGSVAEEEDGDVQEEYTEADYLGWTEWLTLVCDRSMPSVLAPGRLQFLCMHTDSWEVVSTQVQADPRSSI